MPAFRKHAARPSASALALAAAFACGVAPASGQEGGRASQFTEVEDAAFLLSGSLSNAWGDYDRDGWPDLAVSIKTGEIRLYRNDKGRLVSVGERLGLPTSGPQYRGLSWGDFDRDGYLDLFAGATSKDDMPVLFHNDRSAGFVNITEEAGLLQSGRSARQTSWIDYDNDGDLDLYAANRAGPNALYRNDGGVFTQVMADQGISDPRPTVGACWFDYDEDGDLDVFLANQAGHTDALWRNDGGHFTDVAPELGLDFPGRDTSEGGVGCAVTDFDSDGYLDLFLASYGHNALYRNLGGGRFDNVAHAVGLDFENHAVGGAWGDFDNDGRPDLSIMSYTGGSGEQRPTNRLMHNESGGFTDVIGSTPAINRGDHGVQWVDFDRDGALDLSITNGYAAQGGHYLFRNTLPVEQRHSLAVMVRGAAGHFTLPGSEVRLFAEDGTLLGSGLVSTGDGYNSQSALPVRFGLTDAAPVRVEVTFMSRDGRKTVQSGWIEPAATGETTLEITGP